MGQQQLLLVILVTIIVGIATVVAINTFGSAADAANVDAVRQDLAAAAASAQGFYIKPELLGGGGRGFDGMTFNDITFAGEVDGANASLASNENGDYAITGATGDVLTITGTAINGTVLTANVGPNTATIEVTTEGGETATTN